MDHTRWQHSSALTDVFNLKHLINHYLVKYNTVLTNSKVQMENMKVAQEMIGNRAHVAVSF